MGTFFKSFTETNITSFTTITNSGTPGSVVHTLYENTSVNDFVIFQPHGCTIAGSGSYIINSILLSLFQKNYENGNYNNASVFTITTSNLGVRSGPNLHSFNISTANTEILSASGRLIYPFNATSGDRKCLPFLVWPNEKVEIQSNISLGGGAPGNFNFQWSAHIIRNVG